MKLITTLRPFTIIILLSIISISCTQQSEEKKSKITNQTPGFKISTEEFNKFLYRKADMLHKVKIDSISIRNEVYNVFITDSLLDNMNEVIIRQNVNIILKDFCCFTFETAPFKFVKVSYQIPLRDSSGYFVMYRGTTEETKYHLKLFANLAFSNVMKEIVLANQEFPEEDVLYSLNTALSFVVKEEDNTEFQFFGIDCMNLVIGYLLECENKEGDYYKNKLESVLKFIKGTEKAKNRAVRIKIVERIREAFEKSCETLKNLPAQKVKEKIISL